MNTKERRRLAVLGQVEAGHLSVAEAGHLLDLSERQVRRVWKRYQADGDAGLVHRLRGGPGNRRTDLAVRERALALYGEHYSDFGCTLAQRDAAGASRAGGGRPDATSVADIGGVVASSSQVADQASPS